MSRREISIEAPAWFRLRTVVHSHGWVDLPPFEWDGERGILTYADAVGPRVLRYQIGPQSGTCLAIEIESAGRLRSADETRAQAVIGKMLGLQLDLSAFYRLGGKQFAWAKKIGAGPFLRSASVFEDAVKMLATTNCSWSLTRQMIRRLVEQLGAPGPRGTRAFPSAERMAEVPERFFRDVMKAGYRARYFKEFADRVAEGSLDPERWLDPNLPSVELNRQIRSAPGFGRYAAENLSKLLGRYDGLGIDSWCLKKFPTVAGPVRGDVGEAIEARYQRFGEWQGLALWLELTRDWHDRNTFGDETTKFAKQ